MKTLLLVIDMQKVFAWPTPWRVSDMSAIVPRIKSLAERFSPDVLYSRHVPSERPAGTWRVFYEHWRELERDPGNWDLLDELGAPPERIFTKSTYSCFGSAWFADALAERGYGGLVMAGVESDICVLASAYDAVDAGYPVTVVSDALASGNAGLHQATLEILARMPEQVSLATTEQILGARGNHHG